MPCPELCCLGLDRGDPQGAERPVVVENTRIRAALGAPEAAATLDRLVDPCDAPAPGEYRRHGFTIVGIVGVNRSPSCGVDTTSDHDRELPGLASFWPGSPPPWTPPASRSPWSGSKYTPESAEKIHSIL